VKTNLSIINDVVVNDFTCEIEKYQIILYSIAATYKYLPKLYITLGVISADPFDAIEITNYAFRGVLSGQTE
jgi:hypothetical protein